MWVAEACFEGSEEPYKKLLKPGKRYQIGRKAPAQLILADKTVSQDVGFVEVAAWAPSVQSLKDVNRLPAWPMLHLHVGKKLIRVIPRDDEDHWKANRDTFVGEEAQPTAVREMIDGDHVVVSKNSPPMRILWEPMMFCVYPGVINDLDLREQHQKLAQIGIAVVETDTLASGCTHFVTNATTSTVPFLDALVSCVHIVTGKYITELIRADLSDAGSTTSALELECALPDGQECFPPNDSRIDQTTYEEVKSKASPDEKRRSLFKGITILFASTNEESRAAFKDRTPVFCAAGAHIETVVPTLCARLGDTVKVERFLQAKLSAAQSRAESQVSSGSRSTQLANNVMVIIASSFEHPPEDWYTAFAKVSRKLQIPMPDEGIEALSSSVMLKAPARFLNRMASGPDADDEMFSQDVEGQGAQPQDDVTFVPHRQLEEQIELPPAVQQALAASVQDDRGAEQVDHQMPQMQAQPTQASSVVPMTPSRRPKRRAGIERADPFADLFGSTASTLPPVAESQASEVGATQVSPSRGGTGSSTRLRRNVPAAKEHPRRSDVWRSIFDDNGPSAPLAATLSSDVGNAATQGGSTQERYTKRFRMELDAVDQREAQHELASQGASQQIQADPDVTVRPDIEQTQRQLVGNELKRRAEEDAEDERDEAPATQLAVTTPTVTGDTASRNDDAGRNAPASTQSAALGSDAKFLQSIASMKSAKGKKRVDALDQEFDKLRIVRPNLEASATSKKGGTQATMLVEQDAIEDPAYRAWQEMSVDDFDMGAAGNFIQVDFVPLVRSRKSGTNAESITAGTSAGTQTSWTDRPNFKKFRTKEKDRPRRKPIALQMTEVQDFGIGPAYRANAADVGAARHRATQARSEAFSSAKPSQSATQKIRSIFAKEAGDEEVDTDRRMRNTIGRVSTTSAAASWGMPSARQRVRTNASHDDEDDAGFVRSRNAVKPSDRKRKATPVIDVRLDVDGNSMHDCDLFVDGSNDESAIQSRTAQKGKQSTQPTSRERTMHEVVALDSDDDDDDDPIAAEDSDTGYTFQGFKRKRTQGARARK